VIEPLNPSERALCFSDCGTWVAWVDKSSVRGTWGLRDRAVFFFGGCAGGAFSSNGFARGWFHIAVPNVPMSH
jgi:hypothetical protein